MVNQDASQKFVKQGLTFDDVLLIPAASDVLPADVDLHTNLTKKIRLNIPLISSAMDTVTEYRMAIAIAREGGIGVIHKNMSISQQAEQVDMVKRSENGVITNPFWLAPGHTLAEADELMAKYRISGVPICKDGKLIGIITNRDMKFETDMSQLVDNVMTRDNLVTAREGVEGRVPYKGPTGDTIYQLMGGLRAGMGYTGCHNVEELHTKAQFMQITSAGLKESHPHDIYITKEAPNYTLNPQ